MKIKKSLQKHTESQAWDHSDENISYHTQDGVTYYRYNHTTKQKTAIEELPPDLSWQEADKTYF